ncbi:MAG: hypothetical protein LBQ66_16860 [Planctomycetaceae bacterium]|nr:hypothetical protein [Planctomycetaceae bacterium]
MAFSSNLFGAITHRGGRDARVPVRLPLRDKCCRLRRHWAFWFCRCVLTLPLSASDNDSLAT